MSLLGATGSIWFHSTALRSGTAETSVYINKDAMQKTYHKIITKNNAKRHQDISSPTQPDLSPTCTICRMGCFPAQFPMQGSMRILRCRLCRLCRHGYFMIFQQDSAGLLLGSIREIFENGPMLQVGQVGQVGQWQCPLDLADLQLRPQKACNGHCKATGFATKMTKAVPNTTGQARPPGQTLGLKWENEILE